MVDLTKPQDDTEEYAEIFANFGRMVCTWRTAPVGLIAAAVPFLFGGNAKTALLMALINCLVWYLAIFITVANKKRLK